MLRALAVFAVALMFGCLGPLLPLPKYPHGVHEYLCVNDACPSMAMRYGGAVTGARYNAHTRHCECMIEDSRHNSVYLEIDPHER